MKTLISLLLVALISCSSSQSVMKDYEPAQKGSITAEQAKDFVGQEKTVCGTIASTRFAASSRGRPTFLNMDKPYPRHIFTIVIWGTYRERFGEPEKTLKDKKICVTGKIETYEGKPQIVVTDPSQVKVQE